MTTETQPSDQPPTAAQVEQDLRQWVERAVIGLNLCPFAKAVYVRERVRLVVSPAADADSLLSALEAELQHLDATPADTTDTTLLAHPQAFAAFLDFHFFLAEADALVKRLGYAGKFQVAAFHPQWTFAGSAPDDVENAVNRAPWPTLHLLREESVDRAVAAFPDASRIYERNQTLLREMGWEGWRRHLQR